jgi:hypothetical protein
LRSFSASAASRVSYITQGLGWESVAFGMYRSIFSFSFWSRLAMLMSSEKTCIAMPALPSWALEFLGGGSCAGSLRYRGATR